MYQLATGKPGHTTNDHAMDNLPTVSFPNSLADHNGRSCIPFCPPLFSQLGAVGSEQTRLGRQTVGQGGPANRSWEEEGMHNNAKLEKRRTQMVRSVCRDSVEYG
jgi:hypothetical protein